MRWISDALGPDQLLGMAYYGQGIGRYFAGNTSGQDALSNIGLPGSSSSFSLNALPTYGAIVAYRRFWTPQLRSNLSYAYAHEDYPSYALRFHARFGRPRSALNRDMQQVFVNLIWSPVRHGPRRRLRQRLARRWAGICLHPPRPVWRIGRRGFRRRGLGSRQPHRCCGSRPVLSAPLQIGRKARPATLQIEYCQLKAASPELAM